MVLTITVVGGANGQTATSQEGHAVLSPNDLAQLMSGQTVTGLLNPDGSITLNSNLISTQQMGPTTTTSIPVGVQQNGFSSTTSPVPMVTTTSSPGTFQYCRNIKIDSSNNMQSLQSMNSSDLSNNSPALPMINYSTSNAEQPVMAQQQATQKKMGTKRLTAKQKQALQQQQQQQQQQSDMMQSTDTRQQQLMTTNLDQTSMGQHQQPQVVATIQLPNGQIGQLIAPSGGSWMPNTLNLQQLSMAVAAATGTMPQTLSLPAGTPSNSISVNNSPHVQSPSNNQISQQNQSQRTSMQQQQNQPVSTTTSPGGSDNSNLNNQQQVIMTVQLPNSQLAQIIGRPSQVNQFWSGGPISYSTLTALAQQGIIQIVPLAPGGVSAQSNQGPMSDSSVSNQSVPISQVGSGDQMSSQAGPGGKWTNNPPPSTTMNSQISITSQPQQQRSQQQQSTSSSNARQRSVASKNMPTQQTTFPDDMEQFSSGQSQRKLKRLACTCPNCRDGDHGRGVGDKKKQHICHFPDCNKVYGKTSHLRAHLRWHSGERPYVCGWSFCGKKFTRSDELQRHRRTHTGEKRFECEQCRKKFMRSDHLSKHLRTHLSSKKGVGVGNTQQVQSPLVSSNNMIQDQ